MSESYFFAVLPKFLKVQHSFAKTIKPNTKYRIIIFKGIQKCDEMKEGIKSKLVGGKIDLQSPQLFFNIQFYSPLKNIQFTLKLYEQKPNEEESQIGSFTISSGDYIKTFKNQGQPFYQIDGKFKDDLSIGFDLIIQKSKNALTEALKKVIPTASKVNKQTIEQNKSQSSNSKQLIRQGDGFISPRKRIERKSGHKGKLRSRNSSRSDGQRSQQGSVASSRRKWRKSPPSQQGSHFIHSPKKASPPKISQTVKGKSIPKSQASSKTIERKIGIETKLQSNQEVYKYQPSQITKESPVKSPVSKQNIVEKPQVAKSNIITSPVRPSGLQSPVSQSSIKQGSQTNLNAISPKNTYRQVIPQQSPKQSVPSTNYAQNRPQIASQKKPIVSPTNSKTAFIDLQIKHTPQIFDIVQKKNVVTPTQAQKNPNSTSSSSYQYQPPNTSPKNISTSTFEQKKQVKEKSPQKQNSRSISKMQKKSQLKSQSIDITIKKTQSVQGVDLQKIQNYQNSRKNLQPSQTQKTNIFEQSKVNIKMDGSVHNPQAVLVSRSRQQKSQKTEKQIETKAKQIKKEKGGVHESGTLRGSLRLKETENQKQHEENLIAQSKSAQQRKNQILYGLFLVVSIFLIYYSMLPTRRV